MAEFERNATFSASSKPSGEVMNTGTVNVGGVSVGGPEFVVVAGPCSIENRQQFTETALAVKSAGAALLRGGIWKLRTNPKTFQGLGEAAFPMIREVLRETGMGLVTEVTDARQIEQVDEFVSMYQVGARNMFNYALLKELGLSRKPVLLKRSFSALIEEWVKAADYIISGGNNNVILCERGIRTFETKTRFTFDLNAVIWIKQNTSLPILVDPSHAVGISKMVPQVARAAAAAGADGLIIEVHPRPAEALSDGPQALTVPEFQKLMIELESILSALGKNLHPAPVLTVQ